MMAKIYRLAEVVFTYLGEEDENTGPFFYFLNRDREHVDVGRKDSLRDIAEWRGIPVLDVVKGYVDSASRPWFTRIWVAQEYGLAENAPIFHCGSYTTTARLIYKDLHMLRNSTPVFANRVEGYVNFGLDRGRGFYDLLSCLDQVHHIIAPDRALVHGACVPSI